MAINIDVKNENYLKEKVEITESNTITGKQSVKLNDNLSNEFIKNNKELVIKTDKIEKNKTDISSKFEAEIKNNKSIEVIPFLQSR